MSHTSAFDQTPDAPQGFGYKTCWFAVKASDPAAVVDALQFGDATPANWASGLERAQSDSGWVFVSPSKNGWVLAISAFFPYPVVIEQHQDIGERFDVLFSRLMQRFDDVQFFGSQRVVDLSSWARALNGKPIRIFGYVGCEGEVLANFGDQTPEEAQLRFTDLSGLSPTDANDKMFEVAEEQERMEDQLRKSGLSPQEAHKKLSESGRSPFPDEADVVQLAALWSLNPLDLPEHYPSLGLGLAVRLPDELKE